MKAMSLHHETVIDASAEEVWEVLADAEHWHEWNPTLRDADGPLVPGRWGRMRLRLGPLTVPMQQHVRTVEERRVLQWRSRNVADGVMDVDRTFEITPNPDGGVVLRQSETARGVVAPVVFPVLRRPILAGYERLAKALKDRVEGPPTRTTEEHVSRSTPARADWCSRGKAP